MKRLISLQRGNGNLPRAIQMLTVFLDTFQADMEAWIELAELYILTQKCASLGLLSQSAVIF